MAEMLTPISKKLSLGEPETVEYSVSGDKLILYRRAADKPKESAMADLTA